MEGYFVAEEESKVALGSATLIATEIGVVNLCISPNLAT